VRPAITLFTIQLVLNSVWSVLFFGLQNPGAALVEIVVLWLAIVATTRVFFRRSAVAGALMTPYLLWVSFASFLNFMIWSLNRV
jgi:tryptophan-rich sensory protein